MTQNRTLTTTVAYQVAGNQTVVNANAQIVSAMQQIPAASSQAAIAINAQIAAFNALNPQLVASAQVINTNTVAQQSAANATVQNTSALATQATQVQDLTALYAALDEQAKQAALDQQAAADAGANADAGGGGGLGGLRGGLRATGFLLGSEAGGQIPRAIGQAITLESAFGGVGVIVAGVALATRALTEAEQAAEKAETSRLAVLKEVAQVVATSTNNELQARLQAAQTQLQVDQQRRESIANTKIEVGNFLRSLVDVTIPQLDPEVQGKATALKAALNEQDAALIADQARIDAYTAAIKNNATAANDAAVRLSVMAQNQLTDDQLRQKVDQEDSAQRQTRIAELQREIAINRDDAKIHADNADTVKLLGAEYLKLTRELEFTSEVTDTYADGLKRVADQTQAVSNYFDAITAEGQAEQKTAQARQDVAAAASDHADKLREITTTEQDKETADRQKAAQTAEDDTAKHLQKLAEIDAQYHADHEAAVGNRDALANYQAAQKRDDATSKENDNYTLQEQQLQTHLDQQLLDNKAAQQKQIDAENQSYTKRHNQLVQALNNAQVEESRAAGLALAYQRQANDVQLNERIRANNVVVNTDAVAHTAQETAAVVHQNALANIAYAGGAALESIFAGTMNRLAQIAAGASLPAAFGVNNNGGNYLTGGGNNVSTIQAIVNAQVANMIREANR